MQGLSAADLRARGIDHPGARGDDDLVAAVEILLQQGATLDEIADWGLSRAASARRLRSATWHGTDADTALANVGIDRGFSERLRLAMGLQSGTGLGLTPAELEATRFFAGVAEVLGEEDTLAMVRVIGSSSGRIARATAALLRVNFATPIDRSPAPLADAVAAYTQLIDQSLPSFLDATSTMIRRHLAAFVAGEGSPLRVDESKSAALQRLCVGFADLVGFTAYTEQADAESFVATMSRFEREVQEIVVAQGGTVVKMIGDEVMFVTERTDQAVMVARQLTSVCQGITGLSGMRVGLSRGDLINSGGDFYGTVVNIASRIAGMALSDPVIATQAVVDALPSEFPTTALGAFELRGISHPVHLHSIDPN